MLTSLAIIFLLALILSSILEKLKVPTLLGMLIVGIVLGPYILNLIDASILNLSTDLRQLALIIILTRAGLSLNYQDLKELGISALLMCFVPAVFEIVGFIIFAPILLHLSILESAIMGTVIAAVSPAVVIPRMLKIKEMGYGVDKKIPQLIMAGSSADDVFVIVLFTAFLGMTGGDGFIFASLWQVPVSMFLGIVGGLIFGVLFSFLFKKVHMRDSIKVIILLSFSFLFVAFENFISKYIPFSGLLAIISMGMALLKTHKICAKRLANKYSKLWVAAQILLFVLVGAAVDIRYALDASLMVILLIFIALVFRTLGVIVSTLKTNFNLKERLFCMISYSPKATVQAAIGAIPLSMGLACGNIILTTAVLSIIITAPLGAFGIDLLYKKLLTKGDIFQLVKSA